MLVLAIFAIAAAVIATTQLGYARHRREYVTSHRTALHYSPVQIICGDCSGDGLIPERTFMDRFGRCERCGSHSYMLASERAMHLRRLWRPAEIALEAAGASSHVLRFEPPAERDDRESIRVAS
jgi:hypothetical protein